MSQIVLETERLMLRPFHLGDEEEVLRFSSNPEINKYTGDAPINTLEEAVGLIKNVWLNDYKTYGFGRFAVVHREHNKIIGFCGVKYLPELQGVDLGYRFLPEYWGKGMATESSIAILKDAFERLKLTKIYAFVEPENEASSRVLLKLGFRFLEMAPYPNEEKPIKWFMLEKKDYERQ